MSIRFRVRLNACYTRSTICDRVPVGRGEALRWGPSGGEEGRPFGAPRDVQSGTSIILELPPHLPTLNRGGGKGSRSIPQPTEILAICRDLDNSQAFKRKALTSHPDKGKRELTSTMHPMRPTQNELERFVWTHRLVNPRSQGALRTCSV